MTVRQAAILTFVLYILTALFYYFRFISFCDLFGSCNAGVMAIFLLPALIAIGIFSIIASVAIFNRKKIGKSSMTATILLSLCIIITSAPLTMLSEGRETQEVFFYLPLLLLNVVLLVLNYATLRQGTAYQQVGIVTTENSGYMAMFKRHIFSTILLALYTLWWTCFFYYFSGGTAEYPVFILAYVFLTLLISALYLLIFIIRILISKGQNRIDNLIFLTIIILPLVIVAIYFKMPW